MHFESTISFGNILTFIGLMFAGLAWWKAHLSSERAHIAMQRDLEWRIGNLETWRKEHMVDSDARDRLLADISRILDHVRWQTEYMTGRKTAKPPAD